MLNHDQTQKKLYLMPEQFKTHIMDKQWHKAKTCYDTARKVALFLEIEERKINELFGDRQSDEETVGLFIENDVLKAYYHCAVKRNQIPDHLEGYGIGDKIDIQPSGPYGKFKSGIITDIEVTTCTKSKDLKVAYEIDSSGEYIRLKDLKKNTKKLA